MLETHLSKQPIGYAYWTTVRAAQGNKHVGSEMYGVMNQNDFNCLRFAGTPGAKFTNRDAAEKIAADWNATYGG